MVIFPDAHFVCLVMSSNFSSSFSVRMGLAAAANLGGVFRRELWLSDVALEGE